MVNTEIQHLVSMANDIAANLSFQNDADTRIADHIKRFWAPRMRKLLLEYASSDGEGLSQELLSALKVLRQV
ncbi:formate dehydrogenase subunit delta [Pseudomonadota bacterium]